MKAVFKAFLLLVVSFSFTFGMEDSELLQPKNHGHSKEIVISSIKALRELKKNPQEIATLHLNLEENKISKKGEEFIKNTLTNLIMQGNLLDYVGTYPEAQNYIQQALKNKRQMITIRQALKKKKITLKYRKEVVNETLNLFF